MSTIKYSIRILPPSGDLVKCILSEDCTTHEIELVNVYKDFNIQSEDTLIDVELRLSDMQPEVVEEYPTYIEEDFGELIEEPAEQIEDLDYDSSEPEAMSPA